MKIEKSKLEKEISIQDFSKNGWKLIKAYRNEKNNYYGVVECENCGYKKEVNYYNFINPGKSVHKCKNCADEVFINEIIGSTFGAIKVISFNHKDLVKDNYGHYGMYFNVECTICGKSSVRLYNLKQWKDTTKCKYCSAQFTIPSYNNLYNTYIQGARDRGIKWNLSNEDFLSLITKNCYYCGSAPDVRQHDRSKDKIPVNGIDRLDSNIEYNVENCVPCCSVCNYMKSNYSKNFFLSHIKLIHNHLLEK